MSIREKWWPVWLSSAATGGYTLTSYAVHRGPAHVPANSHEIFIAAITVAGIAVAFLAALEGILLSIRETRLIARLQELEIYNALLRYFSSAINSGMFCIVISAAGLFFNASAPQITHRVFFLVWLFFSTLTAAMCFRVTRLFSKILHD